MEGIARDIEPMLRSWGVSDAGVLQYLEDGSQALFRMELEDAVRIRNGLCLLDRGGSERVGATVEAGTGPHRRDAEAQLRLSESENTLLAWLRNLLGLQRPWEPQLEDLASGALVCQAMALLHPDVFCQHAARQACESCQVCHNRGIVFVEVCTESRVTLVIAWCRAG